MKLFITNKTIADCVESCQSLERVAGTTYDSFTMKKPFLILQLRANDLAAEGEYQAFLKYGGLSDSDVERVRMEKDSLPDVELQKYSGVIVGGGPWDVSDPIEKQSDAQIAGEKWLDKLIEQIVKLDVPYLGACYGFGALAKSHGGRVSKEQYFEDVKAATITLKEAASNDPLLKDLPNTFEAFVGHKEACQQLPEGAVWLGSSEECPYHLFRIKQNIYATQFHPELDADGICERIDVYKNAGYFPPEDAEKLKEVSRAADISVPQEILRRFVERYGE
mgnify:CR=1 FL=1